MATIVDKRGESRKRFLTSRERFLKKNSKAVREAINRKLAGGSIKNLGEGGIDVSVPKGSVHEPSIHHGKGGKQERVLPGNKKYKAGDTFPRPPGGQGGGKPGPGEPGDGEDGEDDFVFNLSEEEFHNILFEELGLPNLEKRAAESLKDKTRERAGFKKEGNPAQMDLVRSKIAQKERLLASKAIGKKKIFQALKEQWQILSAYSDEEEKENFLDEIASLLLSERIKKLQDGVSSLKQEFAKAAIPEDIQKIQELDEKIASYTGAAGKVPKWNEIDLRFRHHEVRPKPVTQAVMFCLMDVSGSMDEEKKANAKLYYGLLYKFLKRNYDQVDVRFIRHTTEAEEVDEETFFYDPKSGGTKVSTAIDEMQRIMRKEYPLDKWNIYGAQASDGENAYNDNENCLRLLHEIMPDVQAYFYTEVTNPYGLFYGGMQTSQLWEVYESIAKAYPGKFFRGKIESKADILPVFYQFFSKKNTSVSPNALFALNP